VLQTGGTIRAGNPELQPFVADSADVALEWYHGKGNYVAVGAFHKDMQSFIVNETRAIPYRETGYPLEFLAPQPNNTPDTLFDVSRPVNGEGATISGGEFAVHQSFSLLPAPFNGLGAIANVTYADGQTTYSIAGERFDLPLFELSRWTANATLYYETPRWGARISYAFRDTYLIGNGPESNIGEGRRPTRNVDLAAFLNATRNLRVVFEATDITEEPIDQFFDVFNNRTGALTRAGRNFLLGATYQF
jgi:iron complex outermembrane receptor protein